MWNTSRAQHYIGASTICRSVRIAAVWSIKNECGPRQQVRHVKLACECVRSARLDPVHGVRGLTRGESICVDNDQPRNVLHANDKLYTFDTDDNCNIYILVCIAVNRCDDRSDVRFFLFFFRNSQTRTRCVNEALYVRMFSVFRDWIREMSSSIDIITGHA